MNIFKQIKKTFQGTKKQKQIKIKDLLITEKRILIEKMEGLKR